MNPRLESWLTCAMTIKSFMGPRYDISDIPSDDEDQRIVADRLKFLADELADVKVNGLPATMPSPTLDRRHWARQFLRTFERLLDVCQRWWSNATEWRIRIKNAASDNERFALASCCYDERIDFDLRFVWHWNDLAHLGHHIRRRS